MLPESRGKVREFWLSQGKLYREKIHMESIKIVVSVRIFLKN